MTQLYVADDYFEEGYAQTGITINWITGVIFVPKFETTLIQDTPTEIRQLDLNAFHLILRDLEDDPDGRPWPDTHEHNTTVTVGGVVLARVIRILPPYTTTFEDGQYAVNLVGANSNVGDRINVNQVSVRSANSAGLQDLSTLLGSAYQGQVVVDPVRGQDGTSVPIGTFGTPSSNVADAITISQSDGVGVRDLLFTRDMTLNEDLTGGFNLLGTSPFNRITCNDAALLTGVSLTNLTVTGQLDGLNVIRFCNIETVTDVSGFIEKCAVSSSITINGPILIMECYNKADIGEISTFVAPAGTSLKTLDFHGSVNIEGVVDGEHIIGVDGEGSCTLDTTCTGGVIRVRGNPFQIIDNSGVGCTVLDERNRGMDSIDRAMLEEVHRMRGLDADNPLVITTSAMTSGGINLNITGDGVTNSTVTRAPPVPLRNIVDEFGNFLVDELSNNIVG